MLAAFGYWRLYGSSPLPQIRYASFQPNQPCTQSVLDIPVFVQQRFGGGWVGVDAVTALIVAGQRGAGILLAVVFIINTVLLYMWP